MMNGIPAGYEAIGRIPEGYAPIDEPEPEQAAPQQDTFMQNALDVGGEFASAFNRSTMQGLDFLGPGTINAGLRLAGSDTQLPTFEGRYEQGIPGSQGGFMDEGGPNILGMGGPRDLVRGAGGAAPAAFGMAPVAGRNLASPAGALAELVGLGTAKPGANIAPIAFGSGGATVPTGLNPAPISDSPRNLANEALEAFGRGPLESETTRRVGGLIDEGSESIQRYGKTRDPYTGLMITDKPAYESAKQGVPEGIVSSIQAAGANTKKKLRDMLDIVEGGKEFSRFGLLNRPWDVAGESVTRRIKTVRAANKDAGERLDDVVDTLRGQGTPEEFQGPFDVFNDRLARMEVDLRRNDMGALEVDDYGSDIMGLKGPKDALQQLVQRIDAIDTYDAKELHRIKKYIDENVSYGKSTGGLSGTTEGIIKELRAGIDNVLDTKFPEYNRVNTQYSDTIELLNETKRLVGSGAGEGDERFVEGLGTLLRRVPSNARSKDPLITLVSRLDEMAKKYGGGGGTELVPYRPGSKGSGYLSDSMESFDDDVLTQVLLASQLEDIFGTTATTSLLGDTTKAAETGADALASQTMTGLALTGAKAANNWRKGINEENAMKALRDLLGK